MKIYVDFDDCICETAKHFSKLVAELFDKDVPYEKINFFNLQKSFVLTDEEYKYMMMEAHKPESLLSYEETVGATKTINEWINCGHDVSIITGRPFSAYEPSREWLDNKGLKDVKLYCLDKYGRHSYSTDSDFSLKLEDYLKMNFDVAIEDSPAAFKFFNHLPMLKVMVYNRPWNKECEFPNKNYKRCFDWEMIEKNVNKG